MVSRVTDWKAESLPWSAPLDRTRVSCGIAVEKSPQAKSTGQQTPIDGPGNRAARRAKSTAARKSAKRAAGFEHARAADERHLERLRARCNAQGRPTPPGMHRSSFLMWLDIAVDGTGRACRTWLFRCRNKPLVGAIRRAALAPDPKTGVCRYDWRDMRARAIAAAALIELDHAHAARRDDSGAWGLRVRGITLGALAAWMQNPFTGERPASTTLNGTHRPGGNYLDGQCGWLTALKQAGALLVERPKVNECEPFEIWAPKPWMPGRDFTPTTNRYWLPAPLPTGHMGPRALQRLARLTQLGLNAHTEEISRRPRRRRRVADALPESQAPP